MVGETDTWTIWLVVGNKVRRQIQEWKVSFCIRFVNLSNVFTKIINEVLNCFSTCFGLGYHCKLCLTAPVHGCLKNKSYLVAITTPQPVCTSALWNHTLRFPPGCRGTPGCHREVLGVPPVITFPWTLYLFLKSCRQILISACMKFWYQHVWMPWDIKGWKTQPLRASGVILRKEENANIKSIFDDNLFTVKTFFNNYTSHLSIFIQMFWIWSRFGENIQETDLYRKKN